MANLKLQMVQAEAGNPGVCQETVIILNYSKLRCDQRRTMNEWNVIFYVYYI